MSETLRKAAIELYGFYDNGQGVERPLVAHETLEGIDHEEYGTAVDGIAAAIQGAYQASESLDSYKARRMVGKVASDALEASPFTDRQIARVALSEIGADWIVETTPEAGQIASLAALVMKSRPVAREFLKLFWWDDALDVD